MYNKKPFYALLVGLLLVSFAAQAKKEIELVDWVSPVPRFTDLDLTPQAVADIVGNGQMIIVQPPSEIELWTEGEVKPYTNVRFATAVAVVNKPVDEVRAIVKDIAAMETYMPQIEDSSVIKEDGKHFMAEWTQVFDIPGPDLNTEFHMQHTMEDNGDISVLLHKGDIAAAAARWEFAKVDESRTLVAYSYWGDLGSAKFVFKILLKAQPELIPSIPAIAGAMISTQLKQHINGETKVDKKEMSNDGLPAQATVPMLTKGLYKQETLEGLTGFGTVLLIHPIQYIQGKKHAQDFYFVSAINTVDGHVSKVAPMSGDYSRIKEYFSWVKKVKTEGEQVNFKIKVKMAPAISLGVDNEILPQWEDDTTLRFNSVGGDLEPFVGAWEYIPLKDGNKDQTMTILTSGLEIGDDAGFVLKAVRGLPLVDMISAMYLGMTILEKQEPWIESQAATPANATAQQ